jgi:hypothetical protein
MEAPVMRERPRSSYLLMLIGVTGVVAAAAVGSAGAVRENGGVGGNRAGPQCPPTMSRRHHGIRLEIGCAAVSPRPAARPQGKAAS